MQKKPNPTAIATKWAVIYLLVSIVITYSFQLLNVAEQSPLKYISYIPFLAFSYLAQKEYKDQLGGFISFGQAFNPGFRYSLFSGLLTAVFIYVYLSILSPEVLVKSMEQQQAAMAAKGMSQEQIDQALEIGIKYGPVFGSVFMAIGTLIFGCIVALIIAAILKRERTGFDIPDEEITPDPTV